MNDELRKKILVRKGIYLGLIVLLFVVSMFWRGVFELPFGNPNYITEMDEAGNPLQPSGLDKLSRFSIKHQAEDNELRELDLGDPEIATAAFEVSLVGSRGLAITILWRQLISAQTRGEWELMQFYSKLLTRLQPHFVQPWLFQAWNIAYNVSVENDQLSDAYRYIANGVSLLGEGDRINTRTYRRGGESFVVGSPDIRYWLGFYLQNKFTVSDKVNTFRSLSELSAIPPDDRDPKRLTVDGTMTGRVDPRKFHEFCEKYPQLVRRLKTYLKYNTREQVVEFLAANRDIPARFELNNEPITDDRAFPFYPRPDVKTQQDLATYIRTVQASPPDGLDILQHARTWFAHAQAVVPPPDSTPEAVPEKYDEFRYRIPKSPALIFFRESPCGAQRVLADRLITEGWFAPDTAWDADATSDAKFRWFTYETKPGESVKPAKPLLAKLNALDEWRNTHQLFEDYGRLNGLNEADRLIQENELEQTTNLLNAASIFTTEGAFADLKLQAIATRNMNARLALRNYDTNRQITNYQFFLDKSAFEMAPETAAVRQLLWNAKELHEQNRIDEEIALRSVAAARWRLILTSPTHLKFYNGDRADTLQEQTLETEIGLGKLLAKDPAVLAKLSQLRTGLQLLSPAMSAVAEGNLARELTEEEARIRIAENIPNEDLDRQVRQLVAETKAKYPSSNPTEEATRRQLLETDFRWMLLYARTDRTEFWVKPYYREQYTMKFLKPEGGEAGDGSEAPPPAPQVEPRQ